MERFGLEKFRAATRSVEGVFVRRFEIPHMVRAMYDVMDNFPWYGAPREDQLSNDDTEYAVAKEQVTRHFIPPHFCSEVQRDFHTNGEFHYHEVPGEKSQHTAHGHRFVANVNDQRVLLLFLDPEHMVGRRNLLRPAVCNVLAVAVSRDQNEAAALAFQRVRTNAISDERLSFPSLHSLTEGLLKNDNQPLTTEPTDISFRLLLSPQHLHVQSRYVGPRGITALRIGGVLPRFIQGKADTTQMILRKFLSVQKQGMFMPKPPRRPSP
jgi:hypothetical protein